jgi:hypothetical protein
MLCRRFEERTSPGGSNTHDSGAKKRDKLKEGVGEKKRRGQGRKRVYTILLMKE